MDEILLNALLSVIAEKGLEALGNRLKRLSRKLWKPLRQHDGHIPPIHECTPSDIPRILQALKTVSDSDETLAHLVQEWTGCAEESILHYNLSIAPKQQNIAKGLFIGSSINQSNYL